MQITANLVVSILMFAFVAVVSVLTYGPLEGLALASAVYLVSGKLP